MSISVSPTTNNQVLMETDNTRILYNGDVPVAIRIGSVVFSSGASSVDLLGNSSVVVSKVALDYIVRTMT